MQLSFAFLSVLHETCGCLFSVPIKILQPEIFSMFISSDTVRACVLQRSIGHRCPIFSRTNSSTSRLLPSPATATCDLQHSSKTQHLLQMPYTLNSYLPLHIPQPIPEACTRPSHVQECVLRSLPPTELQPNGQGYTLAAYCTAPVGVSLPEDAFRMSLTSSKPLKSFDERLSTRVDAFEGELSF